MDRVDSILSILKDFDELTPLNGKPTSIRKYPVRFFILLFTIIKHEGEAQSFYANLLGWNIQNTNMHTNSLVDNGYAIYGEEVLGSYSNRMVRNVYPTKKAHKLMLEILDRGGL